MAEYYEFNDEGDTPNQFNFQIEDKGINYNLDIQIDYEIITFSIIDKAQLPYIKYNIKMNFQEIKSLNKTFSKFYSLNEFVDYIKALHDKNKINIKKYNNKISIFFISLNDNIQIDLFPSKIDMDINIKEICAELFVMKESIKEIGTLKNEINSLKDKNSNEIKFVKEENKELKNEISLLKKANEEIKKDIDNLKYEIFRLTNDNKIKNNKNYISLLKNNDVKKINKENGEIRNKNSSTNKAKEEINKDFDKLKNVNEGINKENNNSKNPGKINKDIDKLINAKEEFLKFVNRKEQLMAKLIEEDNKLFGNNNIYIYKTKDNISYNEKAEKIFDELNLRNTTIEKNKILSIITQNNFNKEKIKNVISNEIYNKLSVLNDVDFSRNEKDEILKTIILLNFNEEEIKKLYKKMWNNNINYVLDENELQMYNELKSKYRISGKEDLNKLKKEIKELKCDRQKITEWIENSLLDI